MKTLPASPDLDHLKKQAKHLLRDAHAGEAAALARFTEHLPAVHGLSLSSLASRELRLHDAQSVVARELGFRSWPELKGYVEWQQVDRAVRLATWLKWIYEGSTRERRLALRMLREEPAFFRGEARLALALGDADGVREALSRDAAWGNRVSAEPLPMPPLVAVTHSPLILEDGFASGLVECARLLLEAGADVDGFRVIPDWKLSALYGAAGKTHHADMTKLLLEAGANPDDNESLYHSVETADPTCMRLLLAAGARVTGTNALGRVLDYEKPDGLRAMLAHGGDVNEKAWVHHAIQRGRSMEVIRILIEAGADLQRKDQEGVSLFRHAVLHGREDVVALLRGAGIDELLTPVEQFVAACTKGDLAAAQAFGPEMVKQLNLHQMRALPEMAEIGDMRAVRVMLAVGWPKEAKAAWDATALNLAVFRGDAEMARLLLESGADWKTQHGFNDNVLGTLSWASLNATAENPPPSDYVGCAQALLDGGVPLAAFDDYHFASGVPELLDGVRLGR